MIGYKLTLDGCGGWMFAGTTPREVAQTICNEIQTHEGLSVEEIEALRIEPFEITKEEIDNMPEFPGW